MTATMMMMMMLMAGSRVTRFLKMVPGAWMKSMAQALAKGSVVPWFCGRRTKTELAVQCG